MKRILMAGLGLLLFSLAHATDPPALKEGLWQVHGQIIENPGAKRTEFTYRLCRNHAYDKAMDDQMRNVKGCRTSFDDRGHGSFVSSSRCTLDNHVVIDSKGTTTYESDTSTRSESRATYSPAYRGRSEEVLIEDQHYLGACPAGMQPGDRAMQDGSLQRYVQ
jgi:hypothetical protein